MDARTQTRLDEAPAGWPCGWAAAVLTAGGFVAIYLLLAGASTLFDRDEARFSQAAVEMVDSGDYLVPTFEGQPRLHKPILIYWLMSAGLKALPESRELAVRMWSALAGGVTLLCTWTIGRRLLGAAAGWLAMAVLGSTLMLAYISSAAVADGVLMAAMMVAMLALVALLQEGPRPRWVLMLGLALGVGWLTKGPVAFLVLLSAAGAWLLGRRSLRFGGRTWGALAAACGIALALFLLWAIPANHATGGAFLREGLGKHVVGRSVSAMESHGGSSWMYLAALPLYVPFLLVFFAPWTLHLPGALSAVLGGRIGGPAGRALILGWSVPTFLAMSLVATKLPHYILFIYPALALAVAGTVTAARPAAGFPSGGRQQTQPGFAASGACGDGPGKTGEATPSGSQAPCPAGRLTDRDRWWLKAGVWLYGPGVLALAAALIVGPWLVPDLPLRLPLSMVGLMILLAGTIAVRAQWRGRYAQATVAVLAGTVAFQVAAAAVVLPAFEAFKLSPPLARLIGQQTDGSVPVFGCGYNEPSLTFYLHRGAVGVVAWDPRADARGQALLEWSRQPGPAVLVTTRPILEAYPKDAPPLELRELGSVTGLDSVKGRRRELVALLRANPPAAVVPATRPGGQ